VHRGFSFTLAIAILLLAGCSSQVRYTRPSTNTQPVKSSPAPAKTPPKPAEKSPAAVSKGVYQTGNASWYGPGFNGNKTASGERFNMDEFTAAHPKLPFNTRVRVVNLENNRSVTVRINDRGPFTKNRIIDLSKAAAAQIDIIKTGTARVSLEVVDK